MAQHALARHTDAVTALREAYASIYRLLDAQAHLWAFVDIFRFFCVMLLCCIPLIFLFKRAKHAPVRQAEVA